MNEHWASVIESLAALVAALVWPTILILFVVRFRQHFLDILEAIRRRIEGGADFQLGASGFSLGKAPKLPEIDKVDDITRTDSDPAPEDADQEKTSAELTSKTPVTEPSQSAFQLTHKSRMKTVKNGRVYYSVRVSLECRDGRSLGDVEKVVYYLHPTFRNRVKTAEESRNQFQIRFSVWGEFTIEADVFLKSGSAPIRLSRYLNL